MKEQIRQWLAGDRNYAAGVELYAAHGTNETLKKLFGHGDYSFSRKKLEEVLEELVQEIEVAQGQNIHNSTESVPKITKNVTNNALRDQIRPLLDERTLLHNKLTMYEELNLDQVQRKQIAIRIKQLSRKIDPLYRHLQAGTAPEQEPAEDYSSMNFAALYQARQNLKCLRSKVKKNPERKGELPEIEAKIKQLTELIEK